jgi:alpha-N-arabinofuranosidase
MAKKATITVHPMFEIGEISPRLYGAFLEPIGTMVNGSMYNPKHPTADKKGFRRDFIDALKASHLPVVRLPGGNFVSGWDWKDSIGPADQRKSHLDLAWGQYYTNEVGHDEYLQWAEAAGAEALYTINLGTGNINDAISIIEYTNHEGGTHWSDLRRKYGHEKPYGVKTWYLGNEMDGPWQIASLEKNPRGYGNLANEVSKAMKWVDPSIETVVCASSSPFLAHYPQWELDMLEQCYESVDYISLHHYHSAAEGDYGALLGGACFFEDFINTEIALCDFVQAKMRSPKKLMLSFDEYGSNMRPLAALHPGRNPHNLYAAYATADPKRKYVRHDPDNMGSRVFPGEGAIASALAPASVLLALLRHADRVKIGCMTGGLQTLASTNHDHVWTPAGNYPITQLMRYGRGVSLQTAVQCDTFDIQGYAIDDNSQYSTHEGIGFIDTAAAFDKDAGELNVFAINRNWEDSNDVELDVSNFEGYSFVEHIQLYSDQLDAKNTYENPDVLVPSINSGAVYANGKVSANLKRLSWNVFRFQKTGVK